MGKSWKRVWSQRWFSFDSFLKAAGYHYISMERKWLMIQKRKIPLQDRSPWGGQRIWYFLYPDVRVPSKRAALEFPCFKILHGFHCLLHNSNVLDWHLSSASAKLSNLVVPQQVLCTLCASQHKLLTGVFTLCMFSPPGFCWYPFL